MARFPFAVIFLSSTVAFAADPVPVTVARPIDPNAIRTYLDLVRYTDTAAKIGQIKIAVLDSGFAGAKERPYLPASAILVENYDPEFVTKFNLGDPAYQKPLNPLDTHGRLLAQLVWAATGQSPDGPKFYLLNANGPTLFRRAVKAAIEAKVDIILFAGTFEGAGNYDGKGPINAAVDEAVAAGILWVNAAGNSGGLVYDGPITVGPDGYLRLGADTALHLRNRLDEQALTITLTWNDYKETEDAGTTRDLDLFVEDAAGRVVGQSTLRQVPPGKKAGEGETTNPREKLVVTDLAATPAGSEYRIRVKSINSSFGPNSRLRVLVAAAHNAPQPDLATGRLLQPVELLEATHSMEIYPPADHPGVLTVGDPGRYSAVGPTADGRVKPDVVLASSIARFTNGDVSDGSSNAAAYFTGIVAVMRASEPSLTANHIREWVKKLDQQSVPLAAGIAPSRNAASTVRYAPQQAANNPKARGQLSPGVYSSASGGTYRVLPGGGVEPNPAPSTPPATTIRRAPPPHAAWQTPSPTALTALVK